MAGPFFIVGSARSGTTLLRLMLNAHPDVAVPPESRFIVELWRGREEVRVDEVLAALDRHERFRLWDVPIAAVRGELNDASEAPYSEVMAAAFRAWARAQGKTRWGDNTPRYLEHIPLLATLFPDAKFVHLIRDGRNVALSYADVPFGPNTVARAAALWATRVSAGMAAGRPMPERYLEVLYEDLVEDVEGEIKDLCAFLEIDFDAGMLDYTEKARAAILPSAAIYNPHVAEKPASTVRSWSEQMPPRHIEVFEAIAGDLISELGYERRFPRVSWRARTAAWLGRMGAPVGRLKGARRTPPRGRGRVSG